MYVCVRSNVYVCSVYYMFSRTRNVVRPWSEHARVGADGYGCLYGREGPEGENHLPFHLPPARSCCCCCSCVGFRGHRSRYPPPPRPVALVLSSNVSRSQSFRGFPEESRSPPSIPLSVDSILFRRSSQPSLSSLPFSTCVLTIAEKVVCSLSGISKVSRGGKRARRLRYATRPTNHFFDIKNNSWITRLIVYSSYQENVRKFISRIEFAFWTRKRNDSPWN